MSGAAEPCGCGGSRSGGGASRLSVIEGLRGGSDDLVVVEGGNWLAGGDGPWDAVVLDAMVRLFRIERCAVVCVGPNEIPRAEQLASIGLPMACLNLRDGPERGIPRWRETRGVWVTSVVEAGHANVMAPEEPLSRWLTELRAEDRVGVLVLHAKGIVRRRLLKLASMSGAGVVVIDVNYGAQTRLGLATLGEGVVVRTESIGRQLVWLSLRMAGHRGAAQYPNGLTGPVATHASTVGVVPLTTSWVLDASSLVDIPGAPTEDVGMLWLAQYMISLRSKVDHRGREYHGFVGSDTCIQCHQTEGEVWNSTKHASAMETLANLGKDGRPDCYACHVTADLGETTPGLLPGPSPPHLRGVGCESCHGPGEAHARDPLIRTREAPVASRCVACHFGKFDPQFQYAERLTRATCQPGHPMPRGDIALPDDPTVDAGR
ncbi:MAG: multiheme c-type cytochrome [Planctomycetota bacterium]